MNTALSTYVQYGQGRLLQFSKRSFPHRVQSQPILFDVIGGQQSGSRALLEKESISIGSDWQNDLFLVGLNDRQIDLEVQNSIMGQLVTVETLDQGVYVNDLEVEMRSPPLRLPLKIKVGEDQLVLSQPSVTLDHVTPRHTNKAMLFMVSCACLALSAFLLFQGLKPQVPTIVHARETTASKAPETLTAEANNLLSELGLSTSVSAETKDGNVLELVGEYSTTLAPAWHAFRRQLDNLTGAIPVEFKVSQSSGIENLPAIAFVSFGPDPHIVLSSGRKINSGDMIFEEWHLTDISPSTITVTRGAESVQVQFVNNS